MSTPALRSALRLLASARDAWGGPNPFCWAQAPIFAAQRRSASGGTSEGSVAAEGDGAAAGPREPETPLLHSIRNRIMIRGGPLSVADYMAETLTNPLTGFYMHRDVFGGKGDFVTSPEISQMFGEMVGIWCLVTWMNLGRPPRLRLVELGPGRGTLMADLLRGAASFPEFAAALEVDLVEISPALRRAQWAALRCRPPAGGVGGGPGPAAAAAEEEASSSGGDGESTTSTTTTTSSSSSSSSSSSGSGDKDGMDVGNLEGIARIGSSSTGSSGSSSGGSEGPRVTWRATLDEVPPEGPPAVYLAHEFFDALPVHQFVRDKGGRGWLEKMVDTAPEGAPGPHHLRFVLSPGPTPAAALLAPRRLGALAKEEQDGLQAVEISAHGMATAERLAQRVGAHGGAALIIDYGRGGPPYSDSLVAIRGHEGVHPLSRPGTADLSAWVDFGALRVAAEGAGAPVAVHGPVPQSHLLLSLGIQARAQALAGHATSADQVAVLQAAYDRLVGEGPDGMGQTYQAMAITQAGAPPPVGFEEGGGSGEGAPPSGGG